MSHFVFLQFYQRSHNWIIGKFCCHNLYNDKLSLLFHQTKRHLSPQQGHLWAQQYLQEKTYQTVNHQFPPQISGEMNSGGQTQLWLRRHCLPMGKFCKVLGPVPRIVFGVEIWYSSLTAAMGVWTRKLAAWEVSWETSPLLSLETPCPGTFRRVIPPCLLSSLGTIPPGASSAHTRSQDHAASRAVSLQLDAAPLTQSSLQATASGNSFPDKPAGTGSLAEVLEHARAGLRQLTVGFCSFRPSWQRDFKKVPLSPLRKDSPHVASGRAKG